MTGTTDQKNNVDLNGP